MTAPVSFGLGPVLAILPDGRRWHFQHGPIDLVIEAFGPASEVAAAYEQAWTRFGTILDELVAELPALRTAVRGTVPPVQGAVARQMFEACLPHRSAFVTPMAAVAGAVADAVLGAMIDGKNLDKAYVNNGGDIALFLSEGESFTTGIVSLAAQPSLDGLSRISAADPVRGVATSGWRGRSFSFGIADSVTVLARTAAEADVAATLIANAVNVEDPAIKRVAAESLAADSDLGDRLVTVEVGALSPTQVETALRRGASVAASMLSRGSILDALLTLQGRSRAIAAKQLAVA